MADSPPLPPKKEVCLALLEGPSVFVHLDPRSDNVRVPKWFKKQPQLVLQVGLNMAVPIPDLEVNDDGIGCTLSFNRTPFWCDMPWDAVYALVGEDGRGMIWPDSVPPELAAQAGRPSLKAVPSAKKKKGKLRSVPPPPDSEPDDLVAGDATPSAPPPVLEALAAVHVAPPKLAAVPEPESEADDSDGDGDGDDDGGGKKKLPSYLRVIK